MNIDEQRKKRCDQLFALGLKFNGESFILKTDNYYIDFHHTDILCDNEEEWNKKISDVTILLAKYDTARI